jgi:hypothetical protein
MQRGPGRDKGKIMSSPKVSPWPPLAAHRPWSDAARRLAASALQVASELLARWAHRVATPSAALPSANPRVEFYAESGAPEGAVYLDGELVGWLPGVQRL